MSGSLVFLFFFVLLLLLFCLLAFVTFSFPLLFFGVNTHFLTLVTVSIIYSLRRRKGM